MPLYECHFGVNAVDILLLSEDSSEVFSSDDIEKFLRGLRVSPSIHLEVLQLDGEPVYIPSVTGLSPGSRIMLCSRSCIVGLFLAAQGSITLCFITRSDNYSVTDTRNSTLVILIAKSLPCLIIILIPAE